MSKYIFIRTLLERASETETWTPKMQNRTLYDANLKRWHTKYQNERCD